MPNRFVLPLVFLAHPLLAAPLTYQLRVEVDPGKGTLQAHCRVEGWPAGAPLFLNGAFTVDRLVAKGKELTCSPEKGQEPLPFRPLSAPLRCSGPLGDSFELSYHGSVAQMASDVNIISPGLVELATYASWYPEAKTAEPVPFRYELSLDLPAAFSVTTNGESAGETVKEGRRITRWRSQADAADIAVVASPALRKLERTHKGFRVEAYHTGMPEALLIQEAEALANWHQELETVLGAPTGTGLLRNVYSPRAGWPYSRLPLTVVSEQRLLKDLAKGSFTSARSFHAGAHEVAHFWWRIADINTCEDWINEGLAEFSALRASTRRFGEPRRQELLASFVQDASECTTHTAIQATDYRSDDRFVNRYEKVSLLLAVLEQRQGGKAMDAFLRAVFQAFRGTQSATTPALLELLQRHLGEPAMAFFAAGLRQPEFPLEAVRKELDLPLPKPPRA